MSRVSLSLVVAAGAALGGASCSSSPATDRLFLDVHHVGAGRLTAAGVAEAHQKDLAVEGRHGVHYERYWLDEGSGTIYCLVRAPSAEAAAEVHRESHGLVADEIREVVPGILPAPATGRRLFMDTHHLEPGVQAAAVAEAHHKDLAVEGRHDVSYLEYWVDEAGGVVHCLAEAPDAGAVRETHREAHGLVPDEVVEVSAGR